MQKSIHPKIDSITKNKNQFNKIINISKKGISLRVTLGPR